MKCLLCKKNEANIIQKFYYDGIETKIGYCHDCLKELKKFHLGKINKHTISLFSTKLFFKNTYHFNKKNIDLKNIKSKILIEHPIYVKKLLFTDDENSKIRDAQTIIKRGLDFWTNEYEMAKNEFDEKRMKAIEKIIKKIKNLL
ncbi:hypothetical protein SAMN02745164_00548 [Marinitoga hydrogenitolerans DSM 16785]|uniref:Uncharacterized protein n=1 Tax=Marinitoga hydrogenitolerans (strain DSM 16785 / JCM 12826 / AT1271) TaxID=1122195 RepID=A0A1M4TY62_MARH1|nr:hypothetical protein [Marinitoga hydrogenitolerans]SHE49343.1 hypothetical protein SAMN02745164_00548 [Marinitoga hydrogenitolerans DSM 16785]